MLQIKSGRRSSHAISIRNCIANLIAWIYHATNLQTHENSFVELTKCSETPPSIYLFVYHIRPSFSIKRSLLSSFTYWIVGGDLKDILMFSIISWYWDYAGNWNPPSSMAMTLLSAIKCHSISCHDNDLRLFEFSWRLTRSIVFILWAIKCVNSPHTERPHEIMSAILSMSSI